MVAPMGNERPSKAQIFGLLEENVVRAAAKALCLDVNDGDLARANEAWSEYREPYEHSALTMLAAVEDELY